MSADDASADDASGIDAETRAALERIAARDGWKTQEIARKLLEELD